MTQKFKCVFALLFILLTSFSFGLSATITSTQTRVLGLRFNATSHSQEAAWTFAVTPGGNYGTLYFCTWKVDGVDVVTYNTLHDFDYVASSPGKHEIKCYLSCGFGVNATPYTIAAIGGPISLGVAGYEASLQPPSHDLNSTATGEDSSKPWYLQYFGYDRSGGSIPTGYQASQYGTVTAAAGQPTGTTYAWTPEAGLKVQVPVTSADRVVNIYGIAGTAGAGKKVKCTYSYTDPTDSSLTGSADDDSDETPPPGSSTTNADFYRFDVHEPKSLSSTLTAHEAHTPAEPDYLYGVLDVYTMTLSDDSGTKMPRVWVTERLSSPGGSGGYSVPPNTTFTSANVGSGCGNFADYLQITGHATAVIPPAGPLFSETQKYYAGTMDLSNSTQGILVGTYYPKLWTNTTSHGTTP